MITEVLNMWTQERREFPVHPQEAVLTAYAQEHGDYDTQGYAAKYNQYVFVATVTVTCGNWCAYLNANESPESRLAKVKAAADALGERGTIRGGSEN